ncbi:MAG: hypothetical protein AAFX75_05155 [Pseudomonadota bacterium]
MEIAEISQSVSLKSARRAQFASSSVVAPPKTEAPVADNTVRALDALRAELRGALQARFSTGYGAPASAFSAFAPEAGVDTVGDETVAAAKQVADSAPGRAETFLVAFRATVARAFEAVRENFAGRADVGDIDAVEQVVNRGIQGLTRDAAGQTESATRVLEVDSKVREASTIRIRTQEGDTVKIRLRNVEQFSATDTSRSGPDGTATSTRVDASQSRRVSFTVEGDINSDERAAIEDVLAQASEIADEFFGGDIAAAFENAADFEFDSEQLQRVNLRFRVQEERSVRFAEDVVISPADRFVGVQPDPVKIPEDRIADLEPFINRPAPAGSATPFVPAKPESADIQPIKAEPVVDDASEATPVAGAAAKPAVEQPPVNTDALNGFFAFVSSFLSETTTAFEVAGESSRFFFSESFKLTLLRETFVASAPESQETAAETAAGVVDKLLEVDAQAPAVEPKVEDDD